jgi:hypothetical protein
MSATTGCGCAICAPDAAATPSPSLQSARPAEVDVELAQMAALFKQMDARHKALFFQMASCAIRLQGKSPC